MKQNLQRLLILVICITFTGLAFATPKEDLGKLVYEDPAFSANGNQSCQSCHHPTAKFSDPVNRISPMYRPVSEGSIAGLFGGRNAPPAAYAAFSPDFYYDSIDGLFIGGLFWDGRATGIDPTDTGGLGAGPTFDPLADQAKGPFGNPVEMGLPTGIFLTVEDQVVSIVSTKYSTEYNAAFPPASLADVPVAYNNIALAISAFEKSAELNRFSSKFDAFRLEQFVDVSLIMVATDANPYPSAVYTDEEIEGLALFNSKGNCAACHPTATDTDVAPEPVFTDFSYDNLGVPVNPVIADLAGPQDEDNGLGAQTVILEASYFDAMGVALPKNLLKAQRGKFKVSSLRNVARTAPYGHNGFFPTLYDIVHFYNTRDILDWPAPEVSKNVNNVELGNLGLTFKEEQKIVVFLETLTDLE